MSEIPAVLPYNPERRFDPQIAIATGSADCAVIFDMFVSFTRSNIRQGLDQLKLADGRYGVRISYATITGLYPWLTEKMLRNRVDALFNQGYLERIPVEQGATPIYAVPIPHWRFVDLPAQADTGGVQKGTGGVQTGTSSFTYPLTTSLKSESETLSSILSLQQTTVSSTDDATEQGPESKAEVVAHAPLPSKATPPAREDLPDLSNPRYAHHRRIAEDAFDRLAQTPSTFNIRQLMKTLSDCEACWTLADMARLLPLVIQAAFDRNKPITSLSGFLRYTGRGGAAAHPFGQALAGERPEPKPEPVTANRSSGWQNVFDAAVEEKMPFTRRFDHEGFFADRKGGGKDTSHLNTRHITRTVALTPAQKAEHAEAIRQQAYRMRHEEVAP